MWDVVALQLAFILAYPIRHDSLLPYTSNIYRTLAIMFVVVDILIAAVFNTMHNVLKRSNYQEAIQTIKQALLVFVVITLYLFSTQSGDVYSCITLYLTAIFHFIFGYATRLAWKPAVRRMRKDSHKAAMLLVADEKQVSEILARLSSFDGVE